MKAWLKGGLIGILIWAVLFVVALFVNPYTNYKVNFAGTIIFINICPMITRCAYEGCLGCLLLGPLISLIFLFLIGAIIGWIVRKIKEKRVEAKN